MTLDFANRNAELPVSSAAAGKDGLAGVCGRRRVGKGRPLGGWFGQSPRCYSHVIKGPVDMLAQQVSQQLRARLDTVVKSENWVGLLDRPVSERMRKARR